MTTQIIKGVYILDRDIYDLDAVIKTHKSGLQEIGEWMLKNDVSFAFGCTPDHYFVCEYKCGGETRAFVKGMSAEIKAMLKKEFPSIKESYQMCGEN